MATYNKKLKTIVVHLLLDDANPITIEDTADDNKATRALNEFKKYGTMHYETEVGGIPTTNGIPYHAVQYIEVAEEDASVTKADPYGCEEGSDTYTVVSSCSDYSAEYKMKIGDTFPEGLFTCETCSTEDYYYVGDLETADYLRVDSTTVLTEELAFYARDGVIAVEHYCEN